MQEIQCDKEVYLTKSFRFGPAIAQHASRILAALGENQIIQPNEKIESKVSGSGDFEAVLARTNSEVINQTLLALEAGLKPHIVGGTEELSDLVSDVFKLMDGKPARHPKLFGFQSWESVVEFSTSEVGTDFRAFVSLVKKYGPKTLWAALKGAECLPIDANIEVSTGHKSKGLEWSSVLIADDFVKALNEPDPAEYRLFYVAATRARKNLIVNPRAFSKF